MYLYYNCIMQNKIKNICDFYSMTHRLKNTLRTGQRLWHVEPDRWESIAEHIYSSQMLAFAINSEFELGLDMGKLALMLAVHELGECIIGDLPATGRGITKAQKIKLEADAVEEILSTLYNSNIIRDIFTEFEAKETPEAKFANNIDKLEALFQTKYTEEKGFNDLSRVKSRACKEKINSFAERGITNMAGLWIKHDSERYFKDEETFKAISEYIFNNDVFKDYEIANYDITQQE